MTEPIWTLLGCPLTVGLVLDLSISGLLALRVSVLVLEFVLCKIQDCGGV